MYDSPKNYENNDIYKDDENALWDDEEENTTTDADTDESEVGLYEKIQRQIAKEQQFIDELETDATEHPIESDEDDSEEEKPIRNLLKRDLQAQALARLEDAARTPKDFENVIAWWDRLDANRHRRERYHEFSRSGGDIPLDFGASEDALYFPDTLNNVLEKQQRKGDFIDAIFYCPYDIHELVAEEYMSYT